MKNITAAEVTARQKAHDAYHGPRIQSAAERLFDRLVKKTVKIIKKEKLDGK